MGVEEFKCFVKGAARLLAFGDLLCAKQSHTKYKQVKLRTFMIQPNMCYYTMTPDDIALLFAMRTRTVRNIRSDFGIMFSSDLCLLCKQHGDTIPGLWFCQEFLAVQRTGAEHEEIYSPSVDLQRVAVLQFRALLQARERILDFEEEDK